MTRDAWKTVLMTVLGIFILLLVLAGVLIFAGAADVAAMNPHSPLTEWALETAREHAVERRAREISPHDLAKPQGETARHFGEACRLCHGAPGEDPSPIGKGEVPEPPDLQKIVTKMKDREIFWVMKNGIKMTGMPAFGKTHSDKELWEMVSLVRALPEMTKEQYLRLKGK